MSELTCRNYWEKVLRFQTLFYNTTNLLESRNANEKEYEIWGESGNNLNWLYWVVVPRK